MLAAGELQYAAPGLLLRQAQALQEGQRRQLGGQGHVFRRREVVNQVVGLKDKGHMAAPVLPQARLRDVLPLEQDVPALGAVQAAQQREQRGFPAAGGAQNRVQLALLQLAAGAPQKGLLAIVSVRQVDKFQKAHGYLLHSIWERMSLGLQRSTVAAASSTASANSSAPRP